jgi:hypothetical protein
VLPDALHEALGQILAEERRQWRRERELIQSEAQRVISDLRATISELAGEIRQKTMDIKPGVPGVAGPPGPTGPSGKLPMVKRFKPSQVFYEGDVVVHNGSTYQALCDTGNGVTHSDWICVAKAGRDGKGFEIRGTYDFKERYVKLDVVALDGAAWVSRCDSPGICPGPDWQMMSRQGKPGRRGETGERGPRGEKGDTGPPAVVPQFLGARVDENYNLLRILSDGSKEIMPLRPAFERYHYETSE